MTSHDCVIKARKALKTKKVGHTGTLDPEVEGVLPLCIGEATKIVPFLTDTKKTYIAEVKLGAATETEDSYGKTVETAEVSRFPDMETIDRTLDSITGESKQTPPMYSAIKVKGKRLYEYARANQPVERPERSIHIYSIRRIAADERNHTVRFEVTCSKGTYIRTLCVDIGKSLGFPAHMSFLERTRTGDFTKEQAVPLEQVLAAKTTEELKTLLLPLETGVTHLEAFEVDEDTKRKISYGQKLPRPDNLPVSGPFRMMHEGKLLAVYQPHEANKEEIKPVRVFQV